MAQNAGRRSVASPGAVVPPGGAERLLNGVGGHGRKVTLAEHGQRWGAGPAGPGPAFLDELDRSGLRGHGGAWFPVAAKWRSLRRTRLRGPVVVANGAEGEPASGKDRLLVHRLPHLVLDGAAVAARTLGASQVVVHVHADAVGAMRQAIGERMAVGIDPVATEIVVAPDRYLAGQESAVVSTLNGGKPATPTFTGITTVRDQGVGGRPTLVQNVETLAQVALIARFGADWFRSVGTVESPGTTLLTVTGRWAETRIVEVALGTSLGSVLGMGTDDTRGVQGVLLGGYGGGWVPTSQALGLPLTEEDARARGSSLGPGVVALLPAGVCPLAEVSRVVRYMEGQGAGQCGPCVNGLASLANQLELLAYRPHQLRGGLYPIESISHLVVGRGACGHPDGVARFVLSALRVFEDHAAVHLQQGPCQMGPPFLPVPMLTGSAARNGRNVSAARTVSSR